MITIHQDYVKYYRNKNDEYIFLYRVRQCVLRSNLYSFWNKFQFIAPKNKSNLGSSKMRFQKIIFTVEQKQAGIDYWNLEFLIREFIKYKYTVWIICM